MSRSGGGVTVGRLCMCEDGVHGKSLHFPLSCCEPETALNSCSKTCNSLFWKAILIVLPALLPHQIKRIRGGGEVCLHLYSVKIPWATSSLANLFKTHPNKMNTLFCQSLSSLCLHPALPLERRFPLNVRTHGTLPSSTSCKGTVKYWL